MNGDVANSEVRKHERERTGSDSQRCGKELDSGVTRRRRSWVGTARMILAGMLALSFLVLAGCVSDPATEVEVSAADELQPSSADLIAEALEAGEIDEPTSMLYRTWLYFGDSKLPEKFIGEEAPYEYGLISEVRTKLDELPADIRALIEPYLLRPNDPRSVFNTSDSNSATASTVGLMNAIDPVSDQKDELHRCSTNWLTEAIVGLNFRVWVCEDPAALLGLTATEALDFTGDIIMEYAPQLMEDMGELIPDEPIMQGGTVTDDRIDVYALPAGWLGPYRNQENVRDEDRIRVPNYARTVQTSPEVGNTTSSYLLVSLDHAADLPLMERMIVHELFHAFHNTSNSKITAAWWTEGIAEWAASYYVRSDSRRLHEGRMEFVMDLHHPSILREDRRPRYGAYIWPFFMEQQYGAKAVFEFVRALATLPAGAGTRAVIAALDEHFPVSVSESYPELAIRIVNMQLAGDPISPRFQDLDAHFPTARQPPMGAFTLGQEQLELNANSLFGLGYRDYRITVKPPPNHPPDTGVLVRVSGQVKTGSGKAPVLQALVRDTDGKYSRVRLAYTGDGDSVCVDEDMILVLANSSTVFLDLTEGALVLQRLDGKPCSQIEVNDPESFAALSEGDTVLVDGIEGDDEPDKTRLIVTVREPDPDAINEYEVRVRVTGDTLRVPQDFTWPLSSFENLGEGAWRQSVPLPLEIDLTDANRPLTIDARLERSGASIDSNSPTVMLHADQEPQCFVDAEISGQIVHGLIQRGGEREYRAFPVSVSKRFEWPSNISLFTVHDYANTMMMMTESSETDYDHDQFHFTVIPFGQAVPLGATGTFVIDAELDYRDFTNIPLAKVDDWEYLPDDQVFGQPTPDDQLSLLRGDATINLTRNLPSAGILEGTISGVFTDEYAGNRNRGHRLEVTLTFATADPCSLPKY